MSQSARPPVRPADERDECPTLRVEHGEIMRLSGQDPDQTMTIRLGTPSLAYSMHVQGGDGPLLEFVLWRSGAR
jgi:hypothetical protein